MIINNEDSDNISKEIKIFSNTDEKLKFLGKILNNDSSREIIQMLIKNEMTANEISLQTKLSLPLILHYLNQMIHAEIVSISKIENNAKNQPMKYYFAKTGILILPEKTITKANNSKSLFRSLKGIMKFAILGIAVGVSWILTKNNIFRDNNTWASPFTTDNSTTISLIIIIIGLSMVYFLEKKKKI